MCRRITLQLSLYLLIVCFPGTAASQTNRDLQSRFDRLVPGSTSVYQIQELFGQPRSKQKLFEWWGGWRNGKFEGMYQATTFESERTGFEHAVKRTLFDLSYPEVKLVFSVFDNPWQLHSITVESCNVSVFGVRVGHSLRRIKMRLGNGEWLSTDGSDYWWLTFEKTGVRFGFLRDFRFQKFPMKLDRRRVVRKIEKFDNKVSFS
jgi:hypothetical protein